MKTVYVLKLSFPEESETKSLQRAIEQFGNLGWIYDEELKAFHINAPHSDQSTGTISSHITSFMMNGHKVNSVDLSVVYSIFNIKSK